MTFSITARCADTGMFGIAVSSSSPAVAARCAHARAGVGAVASQNVTDPALGPRLLDLMEAGSSAPQAVEIVQTSTPHIDYRQITAVDRHGGSAVFSGVQSLGINGDVVRPDVVTAGNLLDNDGVLGAMADAFQASSGHLGDRLINSMQAALAAGGEAGPVHSAGMKLAHEVSWPVADLRCDWTEDCPIQAVATAWSIYKPQLDDYVTRALDPTSAPSYGVPGDE
ncbi:MAG: DUF1028 domain-containing protein [Pseudomonadota bacterium]